MIFKKLIYRKIDDDRPDNYIFHIMDLEALQKQQKNDSKKSFNIRIVLSFEVLIMYIKTSLYILSYENRKSF